MEHVVLRTIRNWLPDLAAIRQDLHAHPELGMQEHRTADVVAAQLQSWGIAVHRGIGGTGVVGVLRSGTGDRAIGLRADMDALPIAEASDVVHRSSRPGVMHACGHDGHTTMLLGAARYLSATRAFDGTVNFIFQPGEEGAGGALAMMEDGLFRRFPCQTLFGFHNRPTLPIGRFAIAPGVAMSAGAFFDVTVVGKGGHAARPELAVDPIYVACQIAAALPSLIGRNIAATDTAVLSVTRIEGGKTYNVVPDVATLGGSARALSRDAMAVIERGLRRLVDGIAAGSGASAAVDFRLVFAPLVNDPVAVQAVVEAAEELVGTTEIERSGAPNPASEDFSFMLEQVPGAYVLVGNGEASPPVHTPHYDFNDQAIPYGAAMFSRLAERLLG